MYAIQHQIMKSIIRTFVEWGHHPEDSEEVKLKKSSLLVVSGPFAIAGLVWGILYFSNDLIIPGSIPFSYGILSISNIIVFGFTKRYRFFRNSQLFLILILPFLLQVSLGGFVPSSAVIYWSIIAPAGAMFFDSIRRSVYWFGAYLLLVVVAYLINDMLPGYVNYNLSEAFIDRLFLMNIIGVSCIVYGILYYFVSTITALNRDIENKNQALKEMDVIKSRFFTNISHEFRTPLTLIIGLIDKLNAKTDDPEKSRDFETVKRNANRLFQLINQLLDLSKLESGEAKLQASRDDIVAFVKKLTAQYESLAADKGIRLSFNGHLIPDQQTFDSIPVYFDHEKLNKIVTNLLSNALKFSPEGGEVAVEVEEEYEKDQGNWLCIRVMNSGDEIPEDKLNHIFDRFYQVYGASNRKYEGTGIGLALVKDLVELHQGKVEVTSKMRKTSFTVKLPLSGDYLDDDEILQTPQPLETGEPAVIQVPEGNDSEIPDPTADPERIVVLVVEDNADLRLFIRDILRESYSVIEAVDGRDGLEKATQIIPDLVVSDVMMPYMDGYDLCRKLKTNNKTDHIPVILLTAKATLDNKLEGLQLGADDYLVKPFDEEELKARIQNLISNREKLQKKFQGELKLKPDEVNVTSRHQQFLDNLKTVIEQNIDNELFGVDDLGKKIGMSRSQIHRKLKALTDQSASTFIRNYRLYRAADLLEQNAGNVTEIAYMVGFNSQTYFSTCFQKLFGVSPSQYKKNSN